MSQEYAGKEKSLKSKFDLVNDLLSVEDLLKDNVVETAFPNVRRLLKIYVLISSSEAVAERGSSKMGQIITKKRTSLEDKSLEMLMRISYHKNPLRINDVKRVLDN